MIKNIVPKVALLIILIYIATTNVTSFLSHKDTGLADRERAVLQAISRGKQIGFQQGVPESYLYYYLMRQKGIIVYE